MAGQKAGIIRFPVTFFANIPAGTTKTFEYSSPGDIMIERLRFLPYIGQELDLRVSPYIRYEATGRLRSMLQLGRDIDGSNTADYLAGNGVVIELPVWADIDEKDRIYIVAQNVSTYDYDLDLIFICSWLGEGGAANGG